MRLVEPIAILDCYADGLGAVQLMKGGNVRFVLYVEHVNDSGEVEGVIVQKTVMHVEAVPEAMHLSWAALGAAFLRNVVDMLPTRVH